MRKLTALNAAYDAVAVGRTEVVSYERDGALANDPPLLIADEPTGNLDPTSAQLVFSTFKKLVEEGKTIMMVTHDKELASQVSRQIEIVNGKITRDENRQRRDWAGS